MSNVSLCHTSKQTLVYPSCEHLLELTQVQKRFFFCSLSAVPVLMNWRDGLVTSR